ncbi:hypothetical protein JCGZ_03065 [Jatropha curcas]|uniref:Uncharacterized protein n=1 Tax=Jatropha curcas TaxID=180498 RepID=A0A067JDL2_JATCU|nr:hypothetical protein JCGZ_03065 [Jatropha curcas]
MEESIGKFSKRLTSFCNHLQTSCDAIKQSVDRRPIPLDSASSTFIQCLNRRVSTASSDLNLLESMSFGTVSFEELLGHCSEVYKKNQSDLLQLEDRLKSFGYVPEVEVEVEINMDDDDSSTGLDLPSYSGTASAASSIMKSLEEDPLMDDSLSLKSLGLSDVCLATLASKAKSEIDDPDIFVEEPVKHFGNKHHGISGPDQNAAKALGVIEGGVKPADAVRPIIEVSKDGYESLPSYMKSLTSWEDLVAAVEKINSSLREKEKTKGSSHFQQDEIASLGLGMYNISCY